MSLSGTSRTLYNRMSDVQNVIVGKKDDTKHPDARTFDSARKKLEGLSEKDRKKGKKRSVNRTLLDNAVYKIKPPG